MAGQVNVSNSHRPGSSDGSYARVIEDIDKSGECPFCPERLRQIHPKPIEIDGQEWVVTENNWPYEGAEHHLLFIAKQHLVSIGEVSVQAWVELQELLVETKRLRKIGGATILMREGDTDYTGASVTHLHAHLISGGNDNSSKAILAKVGNVGSI